MIKKQTLVLLGEIVLITSCKKDVSSTFTEADITNSIDAKQPNESIKELYSIGKAVARLSIDVDFKQTVYSEVAKRFDGDENVLVKTLLDNPNFRKNARISGEQQALQDKVDKLQAGKVTKKKHYPQIYIPNFEELQNRKKVNTQGANLKTLGEEPIVYVFWDGNETANDHYTGYVMNASGELEKLPDLISEEYAQQHEVWVLSFNERMDKLVEQPTTPSNARTSGYRELVYQVKTDDLGYIEGWPGGDLELFLSCASPKFKLFEGMLPSVNRNSVKNRNWATVDHFIFYWYEPDHGTMIGLDWTEKDDGGDEDRTMSYTVPANNGLPSYTYTYKISTNDEYCVYQIVQFADPSAPFQVPFLPPTIYGNQYLYWTMKNTP